MNVSGNNPTMEELEELIEDADRDGSGSVDFQVMILFIMLAYLVLNIVFFIFRSWGVNVLIWFKMYEYEVELNLVILTLT